MIVSTVVGLSIARLLTGLARTIQHPNQGARGGVQFVWVLVLLVAVLHFWWFQFALLRTQLWTFERYVFVVGYAALHFFLATILYPDHASDGSDEDYFMAHRRAFFLSLVTLIVFDTVDSCLKGMPHLMSLGLPYALRQLSFLSICVAGFTARLRSVQCAIAIIALALEILWISYRYTYLA